MNTRRDFLKAVVGTTLATGSSVCLTNPTDVLASDAVPGPRSAEKVLVPGHPWVYAATLPDRDITPVLDQIFADMKYAGLDGIELLHTALKPGDAVQRVGDLSAKHNLPVIGMSYNANLWNSKEHQAILDEVEPLLDRLAKLGGHTLGTSVGQTPNPKTPEQLDAQAELLRTLIKVCATRGIVLNLHNHTYEVANNMHDLRGTLARIPDAKLGPDLNWLVRGGVDPVWFIERFGKQIVFLHLRDQYANGKWSEALGEGDMNYGSISRALNHIHFSGYATIELAHERGFKLTRPLRESLKMSRNYVRTTLGY